MLVCDECGRPDATTITIRNGTANYVKDLCPQHLEALLTNTRAPRRGRPRSSSKPTGSASTIARTARKRAAGKKKPARRTSRARKATTPSK
jgi:hypothetical protein